MDKITVKTEKIKKETQETKTIHLNLGKNKFNYKPGQFITIFLKNKNKIWPRSYSISSTPKETEKTNCVKITVKNYPDSYSTNYLTQQLKKNDKLTITGPHGTFILKKKQKPVYIALGIGITPLLSMIKHTNKTNPNLKQTLLYSNKKEKTMAFKKEIEKIKNPNFQYHFFITQEKTKHKNQKINSQTIKKHIKKINEKTFFLCGNPKLVKEMKKELQKLKLKKEQIKTEEFLRPTKTTYYS